MNNNQSIPSFSIPCESKSVVDADGTLRKQYSCNLFQTLSGKPGYCFTVFGSDTIAPAICQPCVMGNYCPWEKDAEVPSVQYSSDPAVMCPETYYCPTFSTKFKCPPGFYCPAGSSFPVPCSTHLPEALSVLVEDFNEEVDASGYVCVRNSLVPVNCPAGYYCPTAEKSIKCTPGYRCPFMNTLPIKCSDFAYCPSGSVIPAFHAVVLASVFIIAATLVLTTYLSRWKTRSRRFLTTTQATDQRVPVPLEISFENLKMFLKSEPDRCIINGISGKFSPGTMTAILGGSGAGKSSLLSALASLTPYANVTTDSLRLNGCEATLLDCKKISSFVAQSDILFTHLSVYENLYFCAKTRLPKGTTRKEIDAIIDDTLDSLDLMPMKHQIVGSEAKRSLSGGQVKRVSIAMALVAKPTLLLADEITSGLSSNDALILISMLKKLSIKLGITVIIVLHQPRFAIFEQFDQALVLQATPSGAKLVYSGKPSDLPEYMESLGVHRDENDNPADRFIDCVSQYSQEDPYKLPSFYESRISVIERCPSFETLTEASKYITQRLEYPIPTNNFDLTLTRNVPNWYVQIIQYMLILIRHDFARSTFVFAVELTVYSLASIIISQLATSMVDELAMRIKIQSAVSLVYSVLCGISGTLVRSKNILMVQRIINDGYNRVYEITGLLLYNILMSGVVRVLCFFTTYQAILLPFFSFEVFLIFWIQYARLTIIGIIVSTFIRDAANASLLSGFLGIVDGFIFTGPLMIIEGPFLLFLSRATGGGFLGTEIIYWIMRQESTIAGFTAYSDRVYYQTGIPIPDADSNMLRKGIIDLTCSFFVLLAILLTIYFLKRYLEVRVSYKAKVRATIATGLVLLGKTAATIVECNNQHLLWSSPELSIYDQTLVDTLQVKLPSKNFTLPICDTESINFFGNNTIIKIALNNHTQYTTKHTLGEVSAAHVNDSIIVAGKKGMYMYDGSNFTTVNQIKYPYPSRIDHNSSHIFVTSLNKRYTIIVDMETHKVTNDTYIPYIHRQGHEQFWVYETLYNPKLVAKVNNMTISTKMKLPNILWKTEGLYNKLLVYNYTNIFSVSLPNCSYNESMILTNNTAYCSPCSGTNYFKHGQCHYCDVGQEITFEDGEMICKSCNSSFYNNDFGSKFNACMPCSSDMVSTDERTSCVYCNDPGLTVINGNCTECPIGYIMTTAGCELCKSNEISSGYQCVSATSKNIAFGSYELSCPDGYVCSNGKVVKFCDPRDNQIVKGDTCKNCGFLYAVSLDGKSCVKKRSVQSIIVLTVIIFISVLIVMVSIYSFYDIYIVKRLHLQPNIYVLEWGKYHIAAAIFISILLSALVCCVYLFDKLAYYNSRSATEYNSSFMKWAEHGGIYQKFIADESLENITMKYEYKPLNGSLEYYYDKTLSKLHLEDYYPFWAYRNASYSYSGDYLAAWGYDRRPLSFDGNYTLFWTLVDFGSKRKSFIPVLLPYKGETILVDEVITTYSNSNVMEAPKLLITSYSYVNETKKISTPRILVLHPSDPRLMGINAILPFQPNDDDIEECIAVKKLPARTFSNFIRAWGAYRQAGVFRVCKDVFIFLSLCVLGLIIAFDSKFAIMFNCYHFYKNKAKDKILRSIPTVQE